MQEKEHKRKRDAKKAKRGFNRRIKQKKERRIFETQSKKTDK